MERNAGVHKFAHLSHNIVVWDNYSIGKGGHPRKELAKKPSEKIEQFNTNNDSSNDILLKIDPLNQSLISIDTGGITDVKIIQQFPKKPQ